MQLSRVEQNIGVFITFFSMVLFLLYFNFMLIGVDNTNHLLIGLGGSFLTALGLVIFIFRYLRKRNSTVEIDYLNVGMQRYILGAFMVFYGVPKLLGDFFDYQIFALDSKLMDITDFELAWYYFGKNRWQELVSGILEFIPGLFLLHRRTYYLAALILLPVTAQVFILNLFFKIGGLTFPASIILLACNIYIIYSQKESILLFFRNLNFSFDIKLPKTSLSIIKAGKVLALILVGLIIFNKTNKAFIKTDKQLKYEALVGKYSLQETIKNNQIYTPKSDSTLYKDLYIEKQSRWNMLRKYDNTISPYILEMDNNNDSIGIYLNRGGIGDDPDIIDSLSVLEGVYNLNDSILTINGVQLGDTLVLKYIKQDIKPKEWFW
jgi:hypothetical protein